MLRGIIGEIINYKWLNTPFTYCLLQSDLQKWMNKNRKKNKVHLFSLPKSSISMDPPSHLLSLPLSLPYSLSILLLFVKSKMRSFSTKFVHLLLFPLPSISPTLSLALLVVSNCSSWTIHTLYHLHNSYRLP